VKWFEAVYENSGLQTSIEFPDNTKDSLYLPCQLVNYKN
jgi:hypothetical protein